MERDQFIGIRCTQSERQRLESAAALAGYDKLSAYLRERLLGHDRSHHFEPWGVPGGIPIPTATHSPDSTLQTAMLAVLLTLQSRRSASGDIASIQAELMRAREMGVAPDRLLALLAPELARSLEALER